MAAWLRQAVPPEEFGELAADAWLCQAAGRGGRLHDVIQQAVRDALQSEGLDAELCRAIKSGGATHCSPVKITEPSTGDGLAESVALPPAAPSLPDPRGAAGVPPQATDGALTEVTARMLDAGEMYEFSGSVWNAAMLLGHPCLGLEASVALALAIALNAIFQVSFCVIVWRYMLEDDLSDDYLDRLLAFRLGVAHHVSYADTVGYQSLARQVCDRDPKLSTSATHTSLIQNYEKFHEGGPFLMFLALFLWMAYIVREVRLAFAQLHALRSTPRGPRTTVVLVGGDEEDPDDRHPRTHPAYLDRLVVTARIAEFTQLRVLAIGVGIVLPRLVLAGLLGVIGVIYLGRTGRMEDLVLNAIALNFVLGIDEDFFETFLPRRVQTLVRNLEAAPLNETRQVRRHPTMESLMALIAIIVGIFVGVALVGEPFLFRLVQSRDILCSGQLDFVYSRNSASDVVHVAQSAQEPGITEIERIVLQVAQPGLDTDASWNVDPSLVALARGGQARVAKVPPAPSLSDAFRSVAQISDSSVAEAADLIPCVDFGTGLTIEWSQETLREILGVSNVSTCMDMFLYDTWLCGAASSTKLRALCPHTCGCRSGIIGMSGPFASPAFGCPSECLNIEMQTWELVFGDWFPCEDTGPGNFSGLGSYLPPFFDMMRLTLPQFEFHFRDFYLLYIKGLKDYITGTPLVAQGVLGGAEVLAYAFPDLEPQLIDELVDHVLTGGLFDEMAAGNWSLFPGTPHPRNLTGCDYLASWEIAAVINVNLCDDEGTLVSIRTWCPVACGCVEAKGACPSACR